MRALLTSFWSSFSHLSVSLSHTPKPHTHIHTNEHAHILFLFPKAGSSSPRQEGEEKGETFRGDQRTTFFAHVIALPCRHPRPQSRPTSGCVSLAVATPANAGIGRPAARRGVVGRGRGREGKGEGRDGKGWDEWWGAQHISRTNTGRRAWIG